MSNQYTKPPTHEDIDWFAVRVVVREGRYMKLPGRERTIAMKLLGEKGYSSVEVADIVRSNPATVTKAWQRDWPIPREQITDDVVGGPVISTSCRITVLSRSKVRAITGR